MTPLSAAQLRVLESVQTSGNPMKHLQGRSQHGGFGQTLRSLLKRQLIEEKRVVAGFEYSLTAAGKAALE